MKNLNDNARYESAEHVAASIKSGDTIWVGNGASIYDAFLEALMKRQDELKDITILFSEGQAPCKILDELKYKSTFRTISFFKEAFVQTYGKDKITFIQSASGALLDMICKEFGVNTVVAAVCPPDEKGYCNVGKAGAYITPLINKHAGISNRIALIDENLPLAIGRKDETAISLASFDCVCMGDFAEVRTIEDITFGKELVG
ncbi:MAG: hypothetical protein CVU91_06120 [Firmicutes bacterium HGW-Firmicutes-16]|nr:MAG: hypothetical protein CVU91_06120 [Firmicutes bacterium HGW-Firmicutes-16]